MTALLSYIFFFVAWTLSPLQRRWIATKKNSENKWQINFAFQVTVITVILSLVLPFFEPFYLQGNIYFIFILTLICGISWAIYFIAFFVAQKHVEVWVSTLVNNINTPIAIVLATLFLDEKLTNIQILWTIFLLIGMVIVSKQHRIGRFKFDKYFMMVVLSGIALGITITAERALQKMTGFTAGTMFSWWSQCLFLGIITLITHDKNQYSKKDIWITWILRFLQSLSWVVLIFVVWNLSLVSAITTFRVVVVFIAGALFLKERDNLPRKIIGSVVALIGLLLMR